MSRQRTALYQHQGLFYFYADGYYSDNNPYSDSRPHTSPPLPPQKRKEINGLSSRWYNSLSRVFRDSATAVPACNSHLHRQ